MARMGRMGHMGQMKFALAELLRSPCHNLWHKLMPLGRVVNQHVEVPEAVAVVVLADCHQPPTAVAGTGGRFTARLRTETEKAPLRSVCADCAFSHAGECRGASCCGGQIPVEVRLNLTSTGCPRGRWPAG